MKIEANHRKKSLDGLCAISILLVVYDHALNQN
jgi:hypothetical protein